MAGKAADLSGSNTRHELPSYKESSDSSRRPQDTERSHWRRLQGQGQSPLFLYAVIVVVVVECTD